MNHPTESEPNPGWSLSTVAATRPAAHWWSCTLAKPKPFWGGRMRRKRGLECLHGRNKVDGSCWFYHMTKGFLWFIEFLFEKIWLVGGIWYFEIFWSDTCLSHAFFWVFEGNFYFGEVTPHKSLASYNCWFLQFFCWSGRIAIKLYTVYYTSCQTCLFFSDMNQTTSEWMKHTW